MTAPTAEQLALNLGPLVEPDYTAEMTLADRFSAFHQQNPHVADALETLAAQWLAAPDHHDADEAAAERGRG